MKDLFNNTANEIETLNGFTNFNYITNNTVESKNTQRRSNYDDTKSKITKENLLTTDAYIQMAIGDIPNLWNVCRDLYNTFFENQAPYSALQFLPVMQRVQAIDNEQLKRFLKNKESRHVLVDNDLLKVVLIKWKPGKVSSVHGHPAGGCVFKILHGKVEELRYTTDESQKIISSNGYLAGSIAYIDDRLGYHAVGNPFGTTAVSLHAYTPGK